MGGANSGEVAPQVKSKYRWRMILHANSASELHTHFRAENV